MNDTDLAIGYGGALTGRPTECRYCRNPATKGPAMATTLLSMGYNFSCMIASDTLFDSSGEFSMTSYPMKT